MEGPLTVTEARTDQAATRLFVSSSLVESRLAKAVITTLNNAFDGDLEFTHARDLGAGDMWKAWIRKSLIECDAGLFLVTPHYLDSQWLSAEFTAFWLSEKPIYILLFSDVESTGLFAPMRDDYQASPIGDKEGIKRFLKNLSELCGKERIPYPHADLISFSAQEAFEECLDAMPKPDVFDPTKNAPPDSTFPRRHLLMDLVWDLELGDDGDSLRATSARTEHFVCQSPVMHYVPVVVAQAANILPFRADEGFDVEVLDYDYPNGRVSVSNKSVVPGGNYSFHLDFRPPLEAGSEVKVRYRFTLPALKVAHREKLRELLLENPELDMRNYESFVIQVLNPTDLYRYTINFAPNCWIDPLPPEATWRGAPFVDESAALLRGAYTCQRNDNGGYTIQIERHRPVVQTRYAVKWLLPRKDDLAG